jgi:hypothetical protein
MFRKNILRLVFISSALIFCLNNTANSWEPVNHVHERFSVSSLENNNEKEYLANGETSSYIDHPNDINPYIVSILALNDIEHNRRYNEVKEFISWYFSKLNYPDQHGLTGTIYDYVARDGLKHPTGQYDSVDGYAGMFLHLIYRYAKKTGDIELIQHNWSKVEDIAYLIAYLQDNDGLTRALLTTQVKYLMDNGEAYGGLTAYLELLKMTGKDDSSYHQEIRDNIKDGIFTQLYDQEAEMFAWATVDGIASRSSWDRLYPDAYAQLFPIYFEILSDHSRIRDHLWQAFNQKYGDKTADFPIEQRIIYELTRRKMERDSL